jgi:hypothetical protein
MQQCRAAFGWIYANEGIEALKILNRIQRPLEHSGKQLLLIWKGQQFLIRSMLRSRSIYPNVTPAFILI